MATEAEARSLYDVRADHRSDPASRLGHPSLGLSPHNNSRRMGLLCLRFGRLAAYARCLPNVYDCTGSGQNRLTPQSGGASTSINTLWLLIRQEASDLWVF